MVPGCDKPRLARRRKTCSAWTITPLLYMGEALALNARLYPDTEGARNLSRSITFRQWDERAALAMRSWGSASTRATAWPSWPTTA